MAAQLHVASVVPDLWIAVVGTEIQKASSHCRDAFCSVGNVCSDGAEGNKDGGIDALGKIQKRPENFLEAVFFRVLKAAATSRWVRLAEAGSIHIEGSSKREELQRILERCLRR